MTATQQQQQHGCQKPPLREMYIHEIHTLTYIYIQIYTLTYIHTYISIHACMLNLADSIRASCPLCARSDISGVHGQTGVPRKTNPGELRPGSEMKNRRERERRERECGRGAIATSAVRTSKYRNEGLKHGIGSSCSDVFVRTEYNQCIAAARSLNGG
jgi:hypothetical protein